MISWTKLFDMVRNKNTLQEKILKIVSSPLTKNGLYLALLGAAFKFGTFYKESIMIREEAKQECDFNEKLYHFQSENLTLQDKCNQLKQDIKELNFQIKHNNEKRKKE